MCVLCHWFNTVSSQRPRVCRAMSAAVAAAPPVYFEHAVPPGSPPQDEDLAGTNFPVPPRPPPGPPPADDAEDEACSSGSAAEEVAATSVASSSSTGKKAAGAFKVHTAACNGKSSRDLFAEVCRELHWREVTLDKRCKPGVTPVKGKSTIYCVMNTSDLLEKLPVVGKTCWITRYFGLPDMCDKGNLARMMDGCRTLVPEDTFDFNPQTWVLPEQLAECHAVLAKAKNTTFIVKPEDGSQGDGIFLIQGVRDLEIKLSTRANKKCIVQRYVDKPLTLDGYKFDFRIYVGVVGGSAEEPPMVCVCREGLARFCTEKYVEPDSKNMHKCMGHLTNYSLNKRSDKFEHSGETMDSVFDMNSDASKRPMSLALQQLRRQYPSFDEEAFFASVVELVESTVAVMSPGIAGYGRAPWAEKPFRSCQLLGFDVMLDKDFRPFLLEVNNSPSLCIDEALPLEKEEVEALAAAGAVGKVGALSREREKGKACRCMDMTQPHYHQVALVDLVVKKTAMGGLFRMLEQLKNGEEPQQSSYVVGDVGNSALYGVLQQVEHLYQQSGGAQKAFTGACLRRTLSPLCVGGAAGCQGRLEKFDLDMYAQKFRASQFSSNDAFSKSSDGLRVFDFLNLLLQVCAKAYPGMAAASAIPQALAALGV
eukprot:TRINITY_DN39592_c0_g2_i1.p1 TRINITY_DN39592_c0_g2~~TRINITY_DN39592_c0_g2_i1.p1  ORF type:complete len:650 (+),score=178.78 TRINITY_DN39592_c0_g2_i1:11-1960(+)